MLVPTVDPNREVLIRDLRYLNAVERKIARAADANENGALSIYEVDSYISKNPVHNSSVDMLKHAILLQQHPDERTTSQRLKDLSTALWQSENPLERAVSVPLGLISIPLKFGEGFAHRLGLRTFD
jgi:hypothetical protein